MKQFLVIVFSCLFLPVSFVNALSETAKYEIKKAGEETIIVDSYEDYVSLKLDYLLPKDEIKNKKYIYTLLALVSNYKTNDSYKVYRLNVITEDLKKRIKNYQTLYQNNSYFISYNDESQQYEMIVLNIETMKTKTLIKDLSSVPGFDIIDFNPEDEIIDEIFSTWDGNIVFTKKSIEEDEKDNIYSLKKNFYNGYDINHFADFNNEVYVRGYVDAYTNSKKIVVKDNSISGEELVSFCDFISLKCIDVYQFEENQGLRADWKPTQKRPSGDMYVGWPKKHNVTINIYEDSTGDGVYNNFLKKISLDITFKTVGHISCFSIYEDSFPNMLATIELLKEDIGENVQIANVCVHDNGFLVPFISYIENQDFEQGIANIDFQGNPINMTQGLHEKTLGDIGFPQISKIEDNTLYFDFLSGDGPCTQQTFYSLDLDTFDFTKGNTEQQCGDM